MTSVNTRLQKIENDLTPKGVVMKYLSHMAQHDTIESFMLWRLSPESNAVGDKTTDALYESVKRGVQSKDKQVIRNARQKAYKELTFLFEIAHIPSRRIVFQEYRYWYLLSIVVMTQSRVDRVVFDKCPELTEYEKLECLIQAKNIMTKAVTTILADKLFSEKISNHYFDGFPILLKEQQQQIENLLDLTQKACEMVGDGIGYLQYLSDNENNTEGNEYSQYELNIDEVNSIADSMAQALFEQAKQEALAEVYETQGQKNKANQVLQRLISLQALT